MSKLFHHIRNWLASFFIRSKSWQEIEYFDKAWEERVKKMAEFIKPGESVMDLGCGEMYLQKQLKNNTYYPVDYKSRSKGTIVCDFNKKEFPGINTDVGFVSGTMEYIKDYKWFLTRLTDQTRKIILSYCTTDNFPDRRNRKRNNWVNNLSEKELVDLFETNRFSLTAKTETDTRNPIFVFEHK